MKPGDSVASIYLDGTYAAKNSSFGDDNAAWKAASVRRMLAAQGWSAARVCEIGCGGGGILVELSKQMPDTQFTGYEPMPEAYAVCRTRAGGRLEFLHESPAGKVPETPFDVALCLDVFEHVEDYMGFLRSLRGLARHFIFHIPLDMNAQMVFRLEPILRVRREVGHLHYFCRETALATLRDSGYAVDRWFYTDSSTSSYANWKFRLMKLPRKALFALAPDFTVRVLGGYPLMVAATPVT